MNTASLNILTVYYKHKPGGFCKRLRMKIEACLARGWRVHYVAVEPFPYTHANLVPHILWTPFSKHDSIAFWIYFFFTCPFFLLWVGWKERVQLLSSVSPGYALIAGAAKKVLGLPMLTLILSKPKFNTDCRDGSPLMTRIEHLMEKWGLRLSDKLLANSKASREAWIEQYGRRMKRITVLLNNVVVAAFKQSEKREKLLAEFSLPRDAFVVTTASVLEPHKNLDCLLEAFSEWVQSRAVLLILGEGVDRDRLTALAEKLGIASQTIFSGWRTDAVDCVQGADLFVFPSLREGLSESLLEAAASGVPCLVSAIPENTEVITNPDQHFPAGRPDLLREKLQRALDDRNHYETLKTATLKDGQRFVFDWADALVLEVEGLIGK